MWPAPRPGGTPANRSVHCAVFTVDIAGFGDLRRDDPVRVHMRDAMYRHLVDSFEHAGVPWADTLHEDRGDGVLVIVPSRFPESVLIDPLLGRLLRGLQAYNRTASQLSTIRLRAALHAGQVYRDPNGLVGEAVNHTCRLLEAAELKKTLAATKAHLAFITSDALYHAVVRHGQGEIDPETFRAITVEEKETSAQAWIHLPGMGPARAWAPAVTAAPRPAPGPQRGGFQGFVFNGETHIEGDAVAGDKHVHAPGGAPEAPAPPPAAAPGRAAGRAVEPQERPAELPGSPSQGGAVPPGAGEDDDHTRP